MADASPPPRPQRLLSFDGGGVKGLGSLCLLRQILSCVGDPKPCEYFDMIAGVSAGGLIAIMLGRLEMTVDDAIAAYSTMMNDIFKKKNLFRVTWTGKIVPKYGAKRLRQKICEIIQQNGENPAAKFRCETPKKCRTVVVARSEEPSNIVHFTDWERKRETTTLFDEATICEVALATTAASTFFKPAKMKLHSVTFRFIDGGLGQNNPIVALRDLAKEYFLGSHSKNFEEDFKFILSVGTGAPAASDVKPSVTSLAKEVIRLATDTQDTHNAFSRQIKGTSLEGKYIRFNAPEPSEKIKLDDYAKQANIIGVIDLYSKQEETVELFESFVRMEGAPASIEQNTVIQDVTHNYTYPSLPWSSLGTSSIWFDQSDMSRYWSHMTLKSFQTYERIYRNCQKGEGGLVNYKTFCDQIPPNSRATQLVSKIWARLHRPNGQLPTECSYRKGFILAVAYMLHIETAYPHHTPQDEHFQEGVADSRREQFKRWPNWIPCRCTGTCRTEWNFANDRGLVRKSDDDNLCKTLQWTKADLKIQDKLADYGKRHANLKHNWGKSKWTPDEQ